MYGNNYGYYNPQRYGNQIGIPTQPMSSLNNQYVQPTIQQPVQSFMPSGLQGKIVDNIDVVKVSEIPLDGSVSYFPLTDNSAIVTKQLMQDGTSKTTIYKPIVEEPKKEETQPTATLSDDIIKRLDKLDTSDILDSLLDEIKDLKSEIKDLKDNKQKVKEK